MASNLALDAFDFVSRNEEILMTQSENERITLHNLLRGFTQNYLMIARDYALFGDMKRQTSFESVFLQKSAFVLLSGILFT